MDELNLKTLEQIPIPEGLEERLSAKIDEWEAKPTTPSGEKAQTPHQRAALRGCRCLLRHCLWRGISSDEQK